MRTGKSIHTPSMPLAWAAFASDPDWRAAAAGSEKDGPLVHHIENRILRATDFSPLK